MKNLYRILLLLPVFAALSTSCVELEDEKYLNDSTVRATLSPNPETFNADGTTVSGKSAYEAVVVLTRGNSIAKDLKWEAESAESWMKVANASLNYEFTGVYHNGTVTVIEEGIKVTLDKNPNWKRTGTLNVKVSDGTVVPFTFTQLGDKPDAAVATETKSLEFGFLGGSETVEYTTNMGDVYSYDVKYGTESSDWITVTDEGTGKVTFTASKWENTENGRNAEIIITVGTEATSIASVTIPVRQLAMDHYYYLYGPSANKLAIEKSIEMEKLDDDNYRATTYFLASEGGKNPILMNLDSRVLGYPCYALAADGKIATVADANSMPQGPEIDVDGLRTLQINLKDMTWTWDRITTPNACPDEEAAKYLTKDYVARDGSMKTWMVEWLRWDGGDITPKLGSPMVKATGNGTAGSGGYAKEDFPASWDDWTKLNKAYECGEIGGDLTDYSDKGRIYHFNEIVTGEARAGIGYNRNEELPNSWKAGATLVDALGDEYVVEYITNKSFTGDNAADEAAHPMVKIQIQGICPYGWHIANMADWLDLAYAAAKASETGDTYPVSMSDINYLQSTNASGKGGIPNFITWLKNHADWPNSVAIADGADAFGFNMFPLGYRYMTQGWQNYASRMQTFIPMSYTDKQAWRFNAVIDRSNLDVKQALQNIDNGQAIFPFRCVKNYK